MQRTAFLGASLTLFVTLFLVAPSARADNWPGWRGPTGQGQTSEKDLPLTWGGAGNDHILWKVPLIETNGKFRLDHNQSSPVVWGDRVFVTVSYWPEGKQQKEYSEQHVVCFQKSDGKRLWDVQVQPGGWLLNDFRGGGYACPTPAVDGERVYVVFGSAVVAAIDLAGKPVWRKEIDPKNFDVTIGASPIIYEDTVLVINDKNARASTLTAYDRKTGEVKWEQKRPEAGFAHSTPVVVELQGKKQMLVAASNAVQGLDPASGKVLWTAAAKGDTASPVVGGGIVYCDSGRGGLGTAVDPNGTGDLTKANTRWKLKDVPEGFSSPIIVGEHLYRVHNPGVVTCWKLATGEPVYKERLQGITSTSASPIATPEGRIYFASAGKSYVIQAGPMFKVLAVNDLGDACHASPAVSDGKIFLKGMKNLYCIGKK
jgi:outer membrane protein assembly factor BamB